MTSDALWWGFRCSIGIHNGQVWALGSQAQLGRQRALGGSRPCVDSQLVQLCCAEAGGGGIGEELGRFSLASLRSRHRAWIGSMGLREHQSGANVCMRACVSSPVLSCPVMSLACPFSCHQLSCTAPSSTGLTRPITTSGIFFYFLSLFQRWANSRMAKIRLLPGGTPAVQTTEVRSECRAVRVLAPNSDAGGD